MKELKSNIFREETAVSETDINTGKTFYKTRASYIVRGDKTALIGGAVQSVSDEVIKSADYAVFTSALSPIGIDRILGINPDIEIAATVAATKNLKEITNRSFKEHVAKDGAVLDLGGAVLQFMITPHLNQPDTMIIYEETSKTLFSGLAFGTYENGNLREFYRNELSRFNPYVKAAAERVAELDADIICPAVGSVTADVRGAADSYIAWSASRADVKKTAAIFYASSSGNTAALAKHIESVMLDNGIDAKRFNVLDCDKEEMINAFYGSNMLAFGTPTIYQNAAKPIWDIISLADLINMRRRPCMVFGSYGWGGEGCDLIYNHLKLLHIRPFDKPFKCVFTPSDTDMTELTKYTKRFINDEI